MIKMFNEICDEPNVLRGIEAVNDNTLESIAKKIGELGITHVIFSGRGTSDHAGIYGQYLFQIFCGMSTGLATPSAISLYGAKNCFKNCLVIAISQSGFAADALEVIKTAKKSGAVTVTITNDLSSPLAQQADYCLYCAAGPEISVAATKTFTSELALVYLLAMRISGKKDHGKLIMVADAVEKIISEKGKIIKETAEKYLNTTEGFVLSRGIMYPVALETALKIQETCYIKMKGYAVSDFYHGPIAQIESDIATIVYVASGAAEQDSADAVDRLISIGNRPLVVTDNPKFKRKYNEVLVLPDCGDEFLKPLVFASFAQLLALNLCISRGGNPDSPRNLKKVTVTK